jgi:hypothetical protein
MLRAPRQRHAGMSIWCHQRLKRRPALLRLLGIERRLLAQAIERMGAVPVDQFFSHSYCNLALLIEKTPMISKQLV